MSELDLEKLRRVRDYGLTGPCPEWPDCDDDEGPCYACSRWSEADDRVRAVLAQVPAIIAALARAERIEALASEVLDLYENSGDGTHQALRFFAGMDDLRAALAANAEGTPKE